MLPDLAAIGPLLHQPQQQEKASSSTVSTCCAAAYDVTIKVKGSLKDRAVWKACSPTALASDHSR